MKTALCFLGALVALSLSAATWRPDNGNGTYTNPLFYDEFSDPDLIRVGDDFYLAGTTMHAMPTSRRSMRHGRAASHAIKGTRSTSNHGCPWKPRTMAGAPQRAPSSAYHGSATRPAAVIAIQVTWVAL